MHESTKLIKELSELNGVPGFERQVRAKMGELLAPVSEEVLKDRLGGIVGKKTGVADGPRILLAGHMDEVGWMIVHITDKGYLRIQPLGGWWTHVMPAQKVHIHTHQGDILGIIGSTAPHALTPEERKKTLNMEQLFLDIGARSKQEAEEMGIRLGDPVTPASDFFTMRDGELWAGKALDNRAGCALAVDILRNLQQDTHPNIVYAGATVQEELGSRGAYTLAHLVQPDIAIALDVGLAFDTPGMNNMPAPVQLGDGPLMFLLDAGLIAHEGLRNLVIDTAAELNIPLQLQVITAGGTDASRFHLHGTGCPSIGMGFATRYMHSHVTLLAREDYERCLTLVTALIKKLDRATVEALQFG